MATQLCSGLAHLNLSSQPHSNKAGKKKLKIQKKRQLYFLILNNVYVKKKKKKSRRG